MADQHAFARYSEARLRLDQEREYLNRVDERLVRAGNALRTNPQAPPIEGIGEWAKIKDDPNVVLKKDWIDFDELKRTIENYDDRIKAEQKAWNSLNKYDQTLINRTGNP